MNYSDDWTHPARTTAQARCNGLNCTPEGVPGTLVMACTLSDEGLCAACARTAAEADRHELRMAA